MHLSPYDCSKQYHTLDSGNKYEAKKKARNNGHFSLTEKTKM